MKTPKILCTLMAGAMLATAFSGCGNKSSSFNDSASANSEASAITGQIYPITRESGSGTK